MRSKRLILVPVLIGALAACTPGSSPSPTPPASIEAPSIDASPSGSDEMESPTGSDEMTESASPEGS